MRLGGEGGEEAVEFVFDFFVRDDGAADFFSDGIGALFAQAVGCDFDGAGGHAELLSETFVIAQGIAGGECWGEGLEEIFLTSCFPALAQRLDRSLDQRPRPLPFERFFRSCLRVDRFVAETLFGMIDIQRCDPHFPSAPLGRLSSTLIRKEVAHRGQ